MKKGLKITGLVLASLLVLIVAAMLIIPVVFKESIREKVETEVNGMVNARVTFTGYKLSFLRSFPNLDFSLNGFSVTGVDRFEGDTLMSVGSFRLVFNILSIFSKEGYEIRSVIIEKPVLNAIVLEDGSANWDIMKEETGGPAEEEQVSSEAAIHVSLRKFLLTDGRISYNDKAADMTATVAGLGYSLSGDMGTDHSSLKMDMGADRVTFSMADIRYLTDASVIFHSMIDARPDSMEFVMKDNEFKINDLVLKWTGMVRMEGDNINTDLVFETPETSFKSVLSLVPAIYMKDFDGLNAAGIFSLNGSVTGIYSSADSIIPDVNLDLSVADGVISYPDLPEKITGINIAASVKVDGKDLDKTILDVERFHFDLAGNGFDMSLQLTSPISDPGIEVSADGSVDLSRLSQALPMDSTSINGMLKISLAMSGHMSMLENEKYDQFNAAGSMTLSGMHLQTPDMPEVSIDEMSFRFTPAYAELSNLMMKIGQKSDFNIKGRLADYIPYLFSDGTVSGNMTLTSSLIDLNEIMDKMPADTVSAEDTTALALVRVPENIDFNFSADIRKLIFDRLTAEDLKGNIIVRDGMIKVEKAGMSALGGSMTVNALYDTRDTLKPEVTADLEIKGAGIKEAFNTFNTVRQLAPAASGMAGDVSLKLNYKSLLNNEMMPVIKTISGNGELRSEMVQLLESKTFDEMKGFLKLNNTYSNAIKDIKASFTISEGRVYVKPFTTSVGRIKLNISGDQGLDRTINYVVGTEIPRAEFGSAASEMLGSLAAKAASAGLAFTPSDVVKVNFRVGGTFGSPVITPFVQGSGTSGQLSGSIKESVTEEVKTKVNDTAREEADKLIADAESKAAAIRQEASVAAKKIRDEADMQSQKLIKEAESKGTIAQLAAKKAAEALVKEAEKRAVQVETEADTRSAQLIQEAKAKADEILK